MGKIYKVHCIKCKKEYTQPEPDDYYCPECLKIRAEVVKKVNAQIASRPRKPVISDLQRFNAVARNGVANIRDLGIKL